MCCGFSENRPLLSISQLPPSPRPWCFVAHTGLPASCSPVSSPQPPQQPGPGLRNTETPAWTCASLALTLGPPPLRLAQEPTSQAFRNLASAHLPSHCESLRLQLHGPDSPPAPPHRRLAAKFIHTSASRSGREGGVCASLPRSSLFGFIASQHEGRKRAGPEDRRTYARHLRGARIINQHVRPKTRADGGGPSFDYTPPRAPRKFCYF